MGLISRVSSRTYRSPKMQIFIREGEDLQAIEVADDLSISELREALDAEDCRLLASGQELNDDEMDLEDYGIQAESTIEIVGRLVGGGRKRKKVKLATLKYYKVTDTGKLERKRKECPVCGAGIFMSNHKDRQYCGRCGLTIVFEQAQ